MAGETIAEAEGNAAAIVHVIESTPPEENPFKTVLTREEEDLHFYFNDDILELSERLEQLILGHDELVQRYERLSERANDAMDIGDPQSVYEVQTSQNMLSMTVYQLEENERQQAQLEQDIIAEIDEAQSEYRRLAENLNAGREDYVRHYYRAQAMMDEYGVSHRSVYPGPGPEGAAASAGLYEINRKMSEYEQTHTFYKLLERGFNFTTTQEALESLAWGAIALVATEIATAGIGKFVAISGVVIRLTKYADDLVHATRLGRHIVARFMALKELTRTRLMKLMRSRRKTEHPNYPRNGLTDEQVAARRASRTCASGAVAFCG